MERVAFLIEDTGERIRCLLNPESIEIRRAAGIHRRSSLRGPLVTAGSSDDPLLATGGGSTEIRLHLLFDLAVEESERRVADVRHLTGPLWNMAEGCPPKVRFIWGKSWNVPGVVTAVAERLEQFDAGGSPRRSWLSLQLMRIDDSASRTAAVRRPPAPEQLSAKPMAAGRLMEVREMPGDGSGGAGERLDQVAESHYGDPAYWRLLASANGIAEPLEVPAGVTLRLPEPGGTA